jgi:hypothetical protein
MPEAIPGHQWENYEVRPEPARRQEKSINASQQSREGRLAGGTSTSALA